MNFENNGIMWDKKLNELTPYAVMIEEDNRKHRRKTESFGFCSFVFGNYFVSRIIDFWITI